MLLQSPNLSIDTRTKRPANVAVPVYLASMSELLLGVTRRENFQLRTDDALCWDHGTIMVEKLVDVTNLGILPAEIVQMAGTIRARNGLVE